MLALTREDASSHLYLDRLPETESETGGWEATVLLWRGHRDSPGSSWERE